MTLQMEPSNYTRAHVAGPLPGPKSAELLSRQEKRESNARAYPRHLPIAIADAASGRDNDGFAP